jgi:arylsulfatase A-like enzyme
MPDLEGQFGGAVGRTYRESTPWWPKPVRAPAGAPNVVFIVPDDIGFADLGCYGSEIETPNIDRLAAGGLRYTNFHTTAMCSPTRASLLTGRNAHAVGMGAIAEWSNGYPGYAGRVTKRAAMLSEMLGEQGYNCLAVGKWHLMPIADMTAAGPFDYWPLQRGFERFYGFHAALTDQWHPELHYGNHPIDVADGDGYHLTEDLVDRSIEYIRDQQSASPESPFFLYLGFGAAHWPHQVPAEHVAKYRGRYDRGWDAVRAERLEKQKQLGVVPADTDLAPRNPGVKAWDELPDDERRLFARMQEVYAAFVDHTDVHIGRLVAYLEKIGQLDNTLLVLLSDNGSSDEGGPNGSVNVRKRYSFLQDSIETELAGYDKLGSEHAYNHYPWGWAQVSNTPLKWYKKDVHGGGVRDPLIVHWPARIADLGGVRTQYHHVTDIAPTVLEILGFEAPAEYRGVPQVPVHGISMAYSFEQPDAPTRKQVQYYEMLGDRAIWHQGWKAVSRHQKGTDFEADRWELYHLDEDFAESRDLAEQHPEKLRELIERWWTEAGRYDVLPLDDRDGERVRDTVEAMARRTYTFYPGMARVDRLAAPDVTNRSYAIAADVELPAAGAEGVLLSAGSRFGGYVMYVRDRRLAFEYVYADGAPYLVTSDREIPAGRHALRWEFTKTGELRGRGVLLIDDERVGEGEFPKTWPIFTNVGGLHCGRDLGTPVSEAYRTPFTFTGTIERVVVELGDDQHRDVQAESRAALAEQ